MVSYEKLFFISIISLWSFISFGETSEDSDILTISPFNCFDSKLQHQLKMISKKDPFVNTSKCEEQCKSKARNAAILLNQVFTNSVKKINLGLKLVTINPKDKVEVKFKPEIEHGKIQNVCNCSTKSLRIFGTPAAVSIILAIKNSKDFDYGVAVGTVLELKNLKGCIVHLNAKPKKNLVDKSSVKVKQNLQKSLASKSGKIVINKPKSKTKLVRRSRNNNDLVKKFAKVGIKSIRLTCELLGCLVYGFLVLHFIVYKFDMFNDLLEKTNNMGVHPIVWIVAILFFGPRITNH